MIKLPYSRKPKASYTRTEKLHTVLRQAIIEQRLAPGARLPEDAIGESFGTSRTIAREALGRLAVEGLVELIPNRGAFVANPTLEEGRNIFAVRKGLERLVVQEVAARMTPEIVDVLRKLVQKETESGHFSEVEAIRIAGEFHLRLAELSGNPLLSRYVTELVSRCSLVLAMYGRPHSADCARNEHQDLVAALESGDAVRAAHLMDQHLDAVAGRALMSKPVATDIRSILASVSRDLAGK
jgi:DNA-binding GntR family transcriptional regulator